MNFHFLPACISLFSILSAGAFSPSLRRTISNSFVTTSIKWDPNASSIDKGVYLSYSSSSRSSPLKLSSDDDFMASLKSRIEEVQDLETICPLVVLDCMLPRQIMKIQVKNPLLMALVRNQIEKETPTFGMLGMATLKTGEKINLTTGVEVELVETPSFVDDDSVLLVLQAGRRFCITGEVENSERGWTEARVKYLDSQEQEEEELGGEDRMAVARAIMKARGLTTPNANTVNNASLVHRWIELARENEREPGQIDQLLDDLGDIPAEDRPSELALWVGALINPLPAMGVAMEIRPALLTATTAERRVEVACDGILRSIKHMDGSAPMW